MNIYAFSSYIEALAAVVNARKQAGHALTLSQLAQVCQMQPSYLTNVLKGRADFNTDQLARVCDQLEISFEENEFLALLLELKKTAFEKRRKHLESKIKLIKSQHLRAEKHITAKTVDLTPEQQDKYYLDPYIQILHIFLSSHEGSASVEMLAQKFSMQKSHVANVLQVLEDIGYIKRSSGNSKTKIEVLVEGRHLPRESPLLKPHHALMRIKSIDQMQRLPKESAYSFSATISTMPEVRTQIQAEFLKFLKAAEKLVMSHDAGTLYQINFDLFPWETE
jgi:DNA-binding MarR family transcriptional regulator/predicted transcriptional regulator